MLKRIPLILTLSLCAIGVAAAPATQTLDGVLDKHFRAIGGADAWRGVTSTRLTGTLSINPPGVEAPLMTVVRRPGKARVEFELMGTTGIQAIDGETAWWHSPLSGAPDPVTAPEATAASMRQTADLDGPLVDWQKSGHSLKLVGETEVDGETLIELELQLATGERMRYFLDADTYLAVKTVDLEDETNVSRFGDYREVDGLRIPFYLETETASGKQTTTIASWETNVAVDDALFAMPTDLGYSSFIELRRYSIQEPSRDRFLEFFEEHYLESQEVFGMRIWGQFRDLEAPGQFVWLRGYQDMEQRRAGLEQFYTSPVWAETGPEAASMLNVGAGRVHFLEPVSTTDGFAADAKRPLLLSEVPAGISSGILVAEVFPVTGDVAAVVETVRSSVVPHYESSGGTILGLFHSSDQPNNFPLMPFIEDQTVVVLFTTFEGREQYSAVTESWQSPLPRETLVLEPGKRSRLPSRFDI
jgi:hypothetical protein